MSSICRIFAGGEIADMDVQLTGDELIICADNGYRAALELGIKPDIIVGDFDSYDGELPENAEILRSVPEKDDTDTLLAIKTAISRGAREIHIYGAMGGRFDHTLANIQSLAYIHEHGCRGFIESSDNVLTVCGEGVNRFPRWDGWYFSVFALVGTVLIESMRGVKYPLTDYPMTAAFPIGVSNEITSSEAVLRIKSGIALIVRSKIKHDS